MLKRVTMLLAALAGPAAAQAPRFDPGRVAPSPGPANRVLVLGTTHLSGLPKTWSPATLDPLLARLAGWRPAIITVESVSGPQCDFMARYPDQYADAVKSYCGDPAAAQRAIGRDMPAATAEIDRLLAAWPASPSPAQRRRLAALFMAVDDDTSALVQWLRLPISDRHAGDGLDPAIAARLATLPTKLNENYLIAAALAVRLGLERVHPVDDHTADAVQAHTGPGYEAAIRRLWDNPATARRQRADAALQAHIDTGAGILALYRAMNAPEAAQLAFDSDFGAALADPSPQGYGRNYVGWWETRNLRMVANIRAILAEQPGKRLLAVVGASHKPYYEAYLGMMHDVKVTPINPLLVP